MKKAIIGILVATSLLVCVGCGNVDDSNSAVAKSVDTSGIEIGQNDSQDTSCYIRLDSISKSKCTGTVYFINTQQRQLLSSWVKP